MISGQSLFNILISDGWKGPDTGGVRLKLITIKKMLNLEQDSQRIAPQRRAESEGKWVSEFSSWGLHHAGAAKTRALQRGA